jgi:hypothetical protein
MYLKTLTVSFILLTILKPGMKSWPFQNILKHSMLFLKLRKYSRLLMKMKKMKKIQETKPKAAEKLQTLKRPAFKHKT